MADKYLMDGHKLQWHADRVRAWEAGERVPPIHIDVGLSKGCNIRCQYCFGVLQGNFYRKGAERVFPREPLLRYMKDAGACGVRSMALVGEGEPLLNPSVYDAIVAGRSSGVDMALGTNGILYDTGAAGAGALEHLTWIRFNISAASEDAYRRIHASKDFQTALAKIRFCVEYQRRRNLPVTIGLQMVLTPQNVDQVVPLARLGRELGVNYLVIKQCSDTVESRLGVFKHLGQYDGFREMLQEAEAQSTDMYDVIVKWNKVLNKGARTYPRCLGVPFLLYSSGDARLYPCGMFFDEREEEFRMGDLAQQSFTEILASERYWEVVERVRNTIDVAQCYANCRTHSINDFLWRLQSGQARLDPVPGLPPSHVNFV